MSKSIFGLILIWFASFSLRAAQPIFTISSQDATHGQIIDVDFHVDHFANIVNAQFSVNWNPAVLKFMAIKNLNPNVPNLNPSAFGTPQNLLDMGQFTMGWFESSVTPVTIPDGSLFFTVEFEVLGNPCDVSPVAITGNPLEIEVAEPNEVRVDLITHNGTVTVPGTGCTEDIEFIGQSLSAGCGNSVCVQFTVQNFVDVGALEFSLVFNSSVLQFDKIQSFAPLQGFGAGNTNLAGPDSIKVVWINGNVENESLPDGTVLFEICFNVIGSGGQSSDITFGTAPEVTFFDVINNVNHTVNITPANVAAQCAIEGFALIGDTVCTQPNGIVCMDVKVNDFDEILTMQFSINWDSTKFIFDHVEGFGLLGLNADLFGTPGNPDVKQGQLTVAWFDETVQGQTLPDYSTIFRVCLKAIGPVGSSSPISFTSIPLPIEVSNLDSVLSYSLIQGRGEIKTSCEDGCVVSFVLNTINPTCAGGTNGVLNLTVMTPGCQCTPTYLWSTGATTQDLTGQPAGSYSVTITCMQVVIASATLIDPSPVSVAVTITDPSPAGSCTGAINITPTGGTPPYTFQWSNPPGGSTEDISNLCAGSYTVTVTDNNGCTFVPDAYLVGADASAAITNVSCNGGSNGAINLTATFGTGPYTYQWSTPPGSTSEDISNLTAGTYCVTITDSASSTRDTCFTVTQPTAIVVSATVTPDANMNCQGAIDLNVTGGTQPYSYKWSPGGAMTQDLIGLCINTYCVTVTDGNACTSTMCYNVSTGNFSVSLSAQQFGNFQTSCSGVCDGAITSTVAGGSGTITYQWSNNQTSPNLTGVCAGTYMLTVTDGNGETATATVTINSPAPLSLAVTKTDPSDIGFSDGAVSVVVTGGASPYTYQWTGPVSGNTAALNNLPGGSYSLLVTDANGCYDTEQVFLNDGGVDCYKGMSVFTPNSDGKNDFFMITCASTPNRLYIFNRQGGLVYETKDYQNTWIGVDNDDEPLPDGGYLWVLEQYGPGGVPILHKGAVILLRTAD